MSGQTGTPPERGGCLTIWLVIMMILNAMTALTYFLGGVPWIGSGMAILLGLLCLVNVASAVGVWQWKRWGVYAFVATAVLATIANILLGISLYIAVVGLVGPVILGALVYDKWALMT